MSWLVARVARAVVPPSVQVIDIIPDLRGEDEDNDDPVMTEDEILVAHLEFGWRTI